MKKRCSIITIIILILIIIALVVALVVTNLKPKPATDEQQGEVTSNEENSGNDQASVDETPTYLALDSEIAIDIASLLLPNPGTIMMSPFHEFQKGYIDQDTMTDFRKIQTAYIKCNLAEKASAEGVISKKDMDEAIAKIFGNANYTPQNFNDVGTYYEYDGTTECFRPVGNGGGGRGAHYIEGVYKIEEYSDRYEVYDKALVIEPDPMYGDKGYMVGTAWDVKNADSTSPEYLLGRFFDIQDQSSRYASYETQEDFVSGITPNSFVKARVRYHYEYDYTTDYKLITKYYDKAMEFKHTFMKNADGSYYWVRSELI